MAETICLHTQEFTGEAMLKEVLGPQSTGAGGLGSLVVGVELADNTYFKSVDYDANRPKQTFSLEWPSRKAERLAEFYERFLMQPKDEESPGWNCHSFVADVMNWNIYWFWDEPHFLPIKRRPIYVGIPERRVYEPTFVPREEAHPQDLAELNSRPLLLKDGQPYAIRSKGVTGHTMFGTPDPHLNLGIEGYHRPLTLRPHTSTMLSYHGNVHRLGFQIAGRVPLLAALWARKKEYTREIF